MQTLEQIADYAGRGALSDQEALVAGVRQRTGMLLAAYALVASFLGSEALREQSASTLAWVGLTALVTGLIVAAILLSLRRLRFSLDARQVHDSLYAQAAGGVEAGTHRSLAEAGFMQQALHEVNAGRVSRMWWLSGVFNKEEARRHRELHPSLIRRALMRLGMPRPSRWARSRQTSSRVCAADTDLTIR